MKKAAAVVPTLRLPIFRKCLSEAGFTFTETPSGTGTVTTLTIEYESAMDLMPILQAAADEANEERRNARRDSLRH